MTEIQLPPPPPPSEELTSLDRRVGKWRVTGGAKGTVTYRWMEGGYFQDAFNADDSVLTGAWVYPGGGGCVSTMTRIEPWPSEGSA